MTSISFLVRHLMDDSSLKTQRPPMARSCTQSFYKTCPFCVGKHQMRAIMLKLTMS